MYETPLKTIRPYNQVGFLFLAELTGEKFQIEFSLTVNLFFAAIILV